MTFTIILALSVFLITLLGTRLAILALRKRAKRLHRPSLRGNYRQQTPRGGGIAVVMALIIGLLIADVDYSIVIALFLLAAVSLLDDLIGVPWPVRLLVQILAVMLPLSMMHMPLWNGLMPLWFDKYATAILWVVFINLFDRMDGADGLSAAEIICIGIGLCLLTVFTGTFLNNLSVYGLITAAAGCGFLWWNWHPAKISLGEVGSIPAGFLSGYLLLLAVGEGYGFAALILPAYYLADGLITLLARQSEHYYQKALSKGWRHDVVTRTIFGVNLLLILLATLSVLDPHFALLYLATAYMAVFMLLGFFAHISPHHETRQI